MSDCLLCDAVSGKRAHVVAFHDMDDVEIADAATLIRKIVKAAGLDHYTVLQNNRALGGQTVFHVHFHFVLAWNEIERLHVERVTRAPVDHGDFGQEGTSCPRIDAARHPPTDDDERRSGTG